MSGLSPCRRGTGRRTSSACEDNPREPDCPALTVPAGMFLAAGRALGKLLATGPPLRSVVPAASLVSPPSAGSPFPGRGDACPPSCRSLKRSDCF